MTTKKTPRKEVAAPSKGRAAKAVKDGAQKSQQLSDRFQSQAILAGRKAEKPGVIKTPSLYAGKRTPGANTPRARAADAAYADYKGLAKKGK